MEFCKVTREDAAWMMPYLLCSNKYACEYTEFTFFTWMCEYGAEACLQEDVLYIRMNSNGRQHYWFPLRTEAPCGYEELNVLRSYVGDNALAFSSLSEAEAEYIKEHFPEAELRYTEDFCDYMYSAADMRTFAGRRFSKKRNHLHQFVHEYGEPVFCRIGADNIGEVKAFYDEFVEQSAPTVHFERMEHETVLYALNNYESFDFVGGFLRVGGKIVGFSIGEYIRDCLCIHIEKADISYKGVYATLVKCFAEAFAQDVVYINREEDMGDLGLRHSKQSYNPVLLLKKYNARIPASN